MLSNHVRDVFSMPCATWFECSGTTIVVRVTRCHCIDRLECCSIAYLLIAYVIINAAEIVGLHVCHCTR